MTRRRLLKPERRRQASERRIISRRQTRTRRQHDLYKEIGKFAGLVASATAAIVGQAELIGEPWRHYVTIVAVGCTAIWAYCMKPNAGRLFAFARKRR